MQELTGIKSDSTETALLNRRIFLKKVIGIFTVFGSLVIGIPFIGSIISTGKERKKKQFIKITNLENLPVNEPQKINFSELVEEAFLVEYETRNVWVVKHSPLSATVFSPICPHLGCSYDWQPQERLFICPCHSSIFTLDGTVTEGPSPRGLDSLSQKIVDGNLYIEWERFEIGISEKRVI